MLKRILSTYIITVQKILITTALFLVYFPVLGITALAARLAGGAGIFPGKRGSGSLWEQAGEYAPAPGESLRQS